MLTRRTQPWLLATFGATLSLTLLGWTTQRRSHAINPEPPALHSAYYITTQGMRILAPGNWTWREHASGSADPRATVRSITVDPGEAGHLKLVRYTTDQTAQACLEAAIAKHLEGSEELARAPYTDWGSVEGVGAVVRFRTPDDVTHRLRVVIDQDERGNVIEVHLLATDDASGVLDRGFQFIERTLEVTPLEGG